jgi:imidazole glycerol-phosphate synthase subunit HisH
MKERKKIIVIDSGLGNINSLVNCISSLDFDYAIINKPDENINFDKMIFPGVGSYDFAMKSIIEKKWDIFIKKNILEKKKFYLGICIGMQVLSSIGYENKKTSGLAIIEGDVKIFNSGDHNIKLPHVGWNDVQKINDSELFEGVKNNSDFYFDHSYVMEVKDDAHSTSLTDYNKIFISSVKKQNVYGVQFHPEKSAENGKKILSNFLKL